METRYSCSNAEIQVKMGESMLSNFDIERAIKAGSIVIEPYDVKLLQPASIDVRLDNMFRVFNNHRYAFIDPAVEQKDLTEEVEIDKNECFILHPGEFVLASTYEVVGVSAMLAARLEGKSSLGRLGLVVHSTAGFIDPGFTGNITLELSNVATLPMKLWPGMKIGQLCFFRLNSMPTMMYGNSTLGSRYMGQRGPTPSRSYQNWTTSL